MIQLAKPSEAMTFTDFSEYCKKSPHRHIQIIGMWAESEQIALKNRGQWMTFLKRHLRAAQQLASFDDEQISEAYEKMVGSEWLEKRTLETLIKFLT